MASKDIKIEQCPQCGTFVRILISYGIYPAKSLETADCPVCGYELFHKNITGDIDTIVEDLSETKEPYKSKFKQ